MVVELYDALVSAGAPEEKARSAAQAMSEESLATKADIAKLERATRADIAKLERNIAKVERELSVVKWMTGAIIAGVFSLVIKSFFG